MSVTVARLVGVSTNRCAKKTTRIIRSADYLAPTHYIARVLAPRCYNYPLSKMVDVPAT